MDSTKPELVKAYIDFSYYIVFSMPHMCNSLLVHVFGTLKMMSSFNHLCIFFNVLFPAILYVPLLSYLFLLLFLCSLIKVLLLLVIEREMLPHYISLCIVVCSI